MPTAGEATVATLVAVVVTASLPCYLYGAWLILDADVVTWRVLTRHLAVIGVGYLWYRYYAGDVTLKGDF